MAILTCAEMISQCLERREPAWRQFLRDHLQFAGAVFDRHFPEQTLQPDEVLRAFVRRTVEPDSGLFRDYSGQGEREFLLYLRDLVIQFGEERRPPPAEPEIALEFEVFEKALAALSPIERQIVWTPLLGPQHDDADQILRLDSKVVASCTGKAQEALRASCDRWSSGLLLENRQRLLAETRSRRTNDCPTPRAFLRLIDGQITWRDRGEIEHHLTVCWHCVDYICRFREVIFLSRKTRPLPDAEIESYLKLLGIEAPAPRWKRLLGAR
jgi:hypothetical protein